MIQPTLVNQSLLQTQSKTPAKGEKPSENGTGDLLSPAPSKTGSARYLVESFRSDGGLDFLRSRLQEKLGGMFEAATKENPELAAKGPEAFTDISADVTPEATADRIVGFAMGLYGKYQKQNPDMSEQELRDGFEQEIRQGIREGFGHARQVIGDLDAMSEDVATNVDLTWDLVQDKLESVFQPESETTE